MLRVIFYISLFSKEIDSNSFTKKPELQYNFINF